MTSRRRIRGRVLTWAVVGPFAIALAFPFYWMFWTALKTQRDLYDLGSDPFSLGKGSPTFDNIRYLFEQTPYLRWLGNTVLVGAGVVALTLVVSIPAGYALARLSGRFGQSLAIAIFFVYLVPSTLLFLPLSRVVGDLGLHDSLGSLLLVYPSFTIPFSTWLLMGFFKSVPREVEEAALIDGASRLGVLRRIVLPLSLPGLLTVAVFAFSMCANEFIYAITFVTSSHQKTLSAGVSTELIRGDVFYWGPLMAATLIPSVPLALLYNSFLDRFIAGVTSGAFR